MSEPVNDTQLSPQKQTGNVKWQSICSLLKLSLTVFSMYQHGVSTNSRGALERECVRPNGLCFPAAGRKECSSYCLPIQFC